MHDTLIENPDESSAALAAAVADIDRRCNETKTTLSSEELSRSLAPAPAYSLTLLKKIMWQSSLVEALKKFLEKTPYQITRESHRGLRFFHYKHIQFPLTLATISYVTAVMILTLDYEANQFLSDRPSLGKFTQSFLNFFAVLLAGFIGRFAYSTMHTLLSNAAEHNAYTRYGALILYPSHQRTAVRYAEELTTLNFYNRQLLDHVKHLNTSPSQKLRARLKTTLSDQIQSYQSWIMTLFCGLTQNFVTQTKELERTDALQTNLLIALPLTLVLMIILHDPHWLKLSLRYLVEKINSLISALTDCLSNGRCCRRLKKEWSALDDSELIAVSPTGDIKPQRGSHGHIQSTPAPSVETITHAGSHYRLFTAGSCTIAGRIFKESPKEDPTVNLSTFYSIIKPSKRPGFSA